MTTGDGMGKDYYQTLGLVHGMADEEIKHRYCCQVLHYHPKNKELGAEEKLKEIAEASNMLSNQHKHKILDHCCKELLKGSDPSGSGSTDTKRTSFSYTFPT
ncbi:DnaJ like protein subfamily B member 1 [Fukomys damarensis]|uniref:DnaJ like protein subfamily B member 1 n=1 Tax=Fukomys damarensis TaxID=885580 RepID=A0A091DJM3_FUKDA|nr:DnaJ like protein subfamily B member 1 [Fukomys damarensis]